MPYPSSSRSDVVFSDKAGRFGIGRLGGGPAGGAEAAEERRRELREPDVILA